MARTKQTVRKSTTKPHPQKRADPGKGDERIGMSISEVAEELERMKKAEAGKTFVAEGDMEEMNKEKALNIAEGIKELEATALMGDKKRIASMGNLGKDEGNVAEIAKEKEASKIDKEETADKSIDESEKGLDASKEQEVGSIVDVVTMMAEKKRKVGGDEVVDR
jgi:hypothetical protein